MCAKGIRRNVWIYKDRKCNVHVWWWNSGAKDTTQRKKIENLQLCLFKLIYYCRFLICVNCDIYVGVAYYNNDNKS